MKREERFTAAEERKLNEALDRHRAMPGDTLEQREEHKHSCDWCIAMENLRQWKRGVGR
jgi:hypothetical protein